ncbi:ribonuclease P protein component [Patescibacteria group bacterium]|nr:ribonuclease P protein component [Patescibacteria group bacterium]
MLPQENRLRQDRDFKRVHRQGRFAGFGFLSLKKVPNQLPDSRLAFLVGLKVSKKAVLRNQVKRRLREATRKHLRELKSGFDVVVFVRPEIAEKSYQDIEECLMRLFAKAQLIKSNNGEKSENY